jgi:PalH/RIM21
MPDKKDVWRAIPTSTTVASGCLPITITAGTVVINATKTVMITSPATYTPFCPYGDLLWAVHRANESIIDWFWSEVTESSTPYAQWQAPYYQNIVSSVLSLSVATVVIWILFAITLLFKNSWLLRVPAGISSGLFITFTTLMLMDLQNQFQAGYFDGFELVDQLNDLGPTILQIVNTTVLLVTEVVTAVRLFPRRKEKRIVLFCGLLMVVSSQVLSAFDAFVSDEPNERPASLDSTIVVSYLFSIATAVLYACCVLFYSIIKWRIAYSQEVLILASLSLASTFLPIVMFILDLADEYLDSYSFYVKSLSLLSASVCVWLWVERIESIERELQVDSVLGRQCFPDDDELGHRAGHRRKTLSISDADRTSDKNEGGVVFEKTSQEEQIDFENSSKVAFLSYIREWPLLARMFRRPGTSSSSRTAYIVEPDANGGRGPRLNDNLSVSRPASIETPFEVHVHPVKRSQPVVDSAQISNLGSETAEDWTFQDFYDVDVSDQSHTDE